MVRIRSEQEMRKHILEHAETLGCKGDILLLFEKYDKLLYKCTNEQERQAIGIMANTELHRFLSSQPGQLVINGKIVIS